jgi:hypothetical protein
MTEPAAISPGALVLQLATAFQGSAALRVAVRLGVPELLTNGARSADDLAQATACHAPSLRRLLRALASLGVLEETTDGEFALAPPGALLRADVPGSLRPLALFFTDPDMHRSWAVLEHCVRTGETAQRHLFGNDDMFARYNADPDFGPVFNAGMTGLSELVGAAVVEAYDFSGARQLVDVGGGHGRLLATILLANPAVRGILLDLPAVVAGAAPVLAAAGVADRCQAIGGDMFADIPAAGDIYVMKQVIHDWDDAAASRILRTCRAAMAGRDARLLLVERVMPERAETTPIARGHALGDLNMLVRTGGRERTESEFARLLDEAGLRMLRIVPTRSHSSLVEAAPA